MGMLSSIRGEKGLGSINYNTGTIFDYHVGSAVQGYDSKFYINGGLGNCMTGWSGKGGLFKSTLSVGLMMNAMGIYKNSDGVLNDTEDAISRDLDRIENFTPYNKVNIDESLDVLSGTIYDIDKMTSLIKEICMEKEKHRKDFIVESPFLDREGKRKKCWIPTFIAIDSFSELEGATERAMLEENEITGKKTNTMWMVDGKAKTIFIRSMRKFCERYGICMLLTAHIGKNIEIDSYGPTPKQLQHMNQNDRLKRVGSEFEFLTGLYMQTVKATILTDSAKHAFYSTGDNTPDTDINEVMAKVIRGKNNVSGTIVPYIISQARGLLPEVTNYHYLKINGLFGMSGSVQKQKLIFYPEVTISRNTIRELAFSSYELRRALELTAQYLFVKQTWATDKLQLNFNRSPEELFDEITKSNSIKMDDLLNSRGYWTYLKDERPYMSIFDVLNILDGSK